VSSAKRTGPKTRQHLERAQPLAKASFAAELNDDQSEAGQPEVCENESSKSNGGNLRCAFVATQCKRRSNGGNYANTDGDD